MHRLKDFMSILMAVKSETFSQMQMARLASKSFIVLQNALVSPFHLLQDRHAKLGRRGWHNESLFSAREENRIRVTQELLEYYIVGYRARSFSIVHCRQWPHSLCFPYEPDTTGKLSSSPLLYITYLSIDVVSRMLIALRIYKAFLLTAFMTKCSCEQLFLQISKTRKTGYLSKDAFWVEYPTLLGMAFFT